MDEPGATAPGAGRPERPEAPLADDADPAPTIVGADPAPTVVAPIHVVLQLGHRQRRLLEILLVLAVVALIFIVIDQAGRVFFDFGDIILTFFLAWLIAFVLSPIVAGLGSLVPRLPRVVAVALVYVLMLVVIGIVVALLAEALARSISDFVASIPSIQERLPEILAPIQQQLTNLGLQVDLVVELNKVIENIGQYATELVGPLQSIAVASLGILGTTLIVVILSLYIIIDSENIRAFTFRLIPPQYHEEWRVFETSVSRSFGGFLRGQFAMGVVYGLIAAATSIVFGLPFVGVTTAASGFLQMIPFFGPFVSWLPPVLVAVFSDPAVILPVLVCMGVGWFVVMNVLQPRLMQETVGLHPIVVLAAVIIGSKIAGIAGAIFGIPIAAVLTSIFIYYFQIFGGDRTVTQRAARRLQAREGRHVRVPREPQAGVDTDVEEAGRAGTTADA
jgi:predicted PurR-regulated permease PerM